MPHLKFVLPSCIPAALALLSSTAGAVSSNDPERHLVAFTFHAPDRRARLDNLTGEQIRWLNNSVLTGAGVEYVGQYTCENGPTFEELSENLVFLKKHCTKHLWPTLFLNTMIGYDPDNTWHHSGAAPQASETLKFQTFRGLDLDNAGGAREIFEANWKVALEIAKTLNSPGLMLDFEAYNDRRADQIGGKRSLAELRGEDPEKLREQIHAFGAELADITHEIYPGATLFCFYTALGYPGQTHGEFSTNAQLTVGMLKRCKQKKYNLRILCGGELGLGYTHPNPDYMTRMIQRRAVLAKPYLLEYPNLELSGVHAPFMDQENRAYWQTDDRVGVTIRTVEDMQPLYELLVKNYNSSWFYGARIAFNPFGPDSERFSKVMGAAKATTSYAPLDPSALDDKLPPMPLMPKVDTSGLKITSAQAVVGAITLVDWRNPDAHGVTLHPHGKFPEINGVLATSVPPETDDKYAAELRIGRWEEGLEIYWRSVWTRVALSDISGHAGIAVDIRNAGKHQGTFHLQVSDHSGKNFHRAYGLVPGEAFTIAIGIEELAERINIADLKAAQFMTGKRTETDLRFQMGPLVAIPKHEANE